MNFAFVVAAACDPAVEGVASELLTVTTGGALVSAAAGAAAGLKKAVIEEGQILSFAGFSAILVTAVYIVWFPNVIRRDTAITVTIGCPSERFLIN